MTRYTEIKLVSDEGETIKYDRTLNTEIKPVSEEGATIKRTTTWSAQRNPVSDEDSCCQQRFLGMSGLNIFIYCGIQLAVVHIL